MIGTPFCFSKFMGVRCRDGAECSFEHQGVFKGGLDDWALKGEQRLKKVTQGAKRPASDKDLGAEAKAQKKDDQGYTQVGTRRAKPRSPSSSSQGSEASVASNASFLDLAEKEATATWLPSPGGENPKQKPQENPLLIPKELRPDYITREQRELRPDTREPRELRPDTHETGRSHSGRGHSGRSYGGRGQGTAYRGDRGRGSKKGGGR